MVNFRQTASELDHEVKPRQPFYPSAGKVNYATIDSLGLDDGGLLELSVRNRRR